MLIFRSPARKLTDHRALQRSRP